MGFKAKQPAGGSQHRFELRVLRQTVNVTQGPVVPPNVAQAPYPTVVYHHGQRLPEGRFPERQLGADLEVADRQARPSAIVRYALGDVAAIEASREADGADGLVGAVRASARVAPSAVTLSTRPPSVTTRRSRPAAGSVRRVGPRVKDLHVAASDRPPPGSGSRGRARNGRDSPPRP